MFGNPIMLGLAIALSLSVAGNSFLGSRWLAARDQVAVLEIERNAAQNAAGMCSKAVSDMEIRAATAAKQARPRVAAATAAAVVHDQRADAILITPPTQPADDCASARDQVHTWLQGRALAPATPASAP
jgi:hypothetical protein